MAEQTLQTKPKPQAPAKWQRQETPEAPIQAARELKDYQQLTTKDMYNVPGRAGRREPGARLVRRWAMMKKIKSKIIDVGKDKEKAWARVAAWIGDEANPERYGERYVCHVFDMMLIEANFDVLKDGIYIPGDREKTFLTENDFEITESGWPRITNQPILMQVMKNHLQKIKFAERDALGKAERAAFLLMLNYETELEGPDDPLKKIRIEIGNSVMLLMGGDADKSKVKLREISAVEGKFPAVDSPRDITSMEHAEEILERVNALLDKEPQGDE